MRYCHQDETLENCKSYSSQGFSDLIATKHDSVFSISHSNVRSLSKNFEEVQLFYEILFESKFKIITMSEVWQVDFQKTNNLRTRVQKPWITNGIKKSIRRKHRLFSKVIKSNYNPVVWAKYRRHRNILTNILKMAKERFYACFGG